MLRTYVVVCGEIASCLVGEMRPPITFRPFSSMFELAAHVPIFRGKGERGGTGTRQCVRPHLYKADIGNHIRKRCVRVDKMNKVNMVDKHLLDNRIGAIANFL